MPARDVSDVICMKKTNRAQYSSQFNSISVSVALFILLVVSFRLLSASEQHSPTASKKASASTTTSADHEPSGEQHPASDSASRPPHLLVILIGGMDSDPTPRQISGKATRKEGNSGLYRLRGDLNQKGVIPEYFNWNGSRAGELANSGSGNVTQITKFIEAHLNHFPQDRLAIVGNSWGGHSAWEVLLQLREKRPQSVVTLAVFLDGSSTGRSPLERKSVPLNVVKALNVYTRNSFVWGKISGSCAVQNVDLGDHAQGFLSKPGPAYDSSLNFKAHVSAEWDEDIHTLIRKQLVAAIPDNKESPPHQPAAPEVHATPATK